MKEIMISIKPKWVALILSGRKTVEIRKRFPKDYLGDKSGYAIHISKLEIYDKPKELSEFSNRDPYPYTRRLTKAPQSWQYVEVEE